MKNTKSALLVAVSALALSCAPSLLAHEGRDEARPQREAHADNDRAAEYHFRQEDAAKLREHYRKIEHVDVAHRHALVAGAKLPDDWHARLRPVPVAVVRELPAPPAGYVFGYLDGYCIVYNPATLLIADVIDLATLPH